MDYDDSTRAAQLPSYRTFARHCDSRTTSAVQIARLCIATACMAVAVLFHAGVHAQEFPAHAVRMFVSNPPGGGTDISARAVAAKMAEIVKQPVIVENRPGAAGQLAVQALIQAPADGYTILAVASPTIVTVPYLQPLPYDTEKDIAPVSMFAVTNLALVVNSQSPIRSIAELVRAMRTTSGGMNFSHAGNGTLGHLAGILFGKVARVNLVPVAYKGATPAITALVAGDVPLMIADLAAARVQADAGRVRILGIPNSQRSKIFPEYPTLAESGYPDFTVIGWIGVYAPGSTPPPVVNKLNATINQALRTPEVGQLFTKIGFETELMTPAEMGAFARQDYRKWGEVIKSANIKSSD